MTLTPIAFGSLSPASLPARHARQHPDRTAVVCDRLRFTWAQWNDYVNRCANALAALGVGRGDRVATVLGNGPELLASYWACAKLGAAAVPLSPLLLAAGLGSLLSDAKPRVVVATGATLAVVADAVARLDFAPVRVLAAGEAPGWLPLGSLIAQAAAAEPAAAVGPDDVLTIMYTSGTTGLPKGIVHTHFVRAMYAALMTASWRMEPRSVVLHTGAIVFNGAMVTMFPAFYCGATYVLERQFDAQAFVDIVEREKVTHTMLVPSQIVAILGSPGFDPARLRSLECLLSLGAPLHQEWKDRLNAVLPGRFYELYGLTEGFVTILDRDDAVRKCGSVGVPPPFYDLRIVDEEGRDCAPGTVGEIVGRGPITMACYQGRPDLTEQAIRDGWLYTGDLGRVDEEGFLYLVDRKKDMIDSGGIKVYPKDIEEIAARHPAVREVAVFGIPHDKWGETPAAAVLLHAGTAASADEVREWINARVPARYQRVERVIVMEDFPRNVAGKTLKREMRERFWEGRKSRI